jgi:peptidoglycan hydrolase-like protein with peptidoglycan-binding domain
MAQFEHNSEKFGYINLEDMDGVQTALTKLDFDPGAIDGFDGPHTQAAVRSFQQQASIRVDGIVGPQTRKALMDALERAAAEDNEPPPA